MTDRIVKLLNLSTSSNDCEALAAIRMANNILKKENQSWNDIFRLSLASSKNEWADCVMPIGKYRGLTLGEIFEENSGYIFWAASSIEGPAGEMCAGFIKNIKQKRGGI